MKKRWKKAAALILSGVLVMGMTSSPVIAASAAPTTVNGCEEGGWYGSNQNLVYLKLKFSDSNWLQAITGITSGVGTNYAKQTSEFMMSIRSDPSWFATESELQILWDVVNDSDLTILADGYDNLVITQTKGENGYTVSVKGSTVVPPAETPGETGGQQNPGATSGQTGVKDAPEDFTVSTNFGYDFKFVMNNADDWLKAISGISVNGKEWSKGSSSYSVWNNQSYYVDSANKSIYVGENFTDNPATCVISADGYKPLTLNLDKTNHTATVVKASEAAKTIDLSQVKMDTDMFGSNWNLTFTNADGYIEAVTGVKVNDKDWTEVSYGPYSGGSYKKNTYDNMLVFSRNDNSGAQDKPVLKSGDVITVSAKGYEDFAFKLVIDNSGKATLVADDGKGDPYELHVKLVGSFECAIKDQKEYDGVSSASVGGASSNKNSAVKVYGALVEKDTKPAENDWEELDHQSKINLDGSKCKVSIVPDVENGTSADSDSGMEGVYLTLSSDLTLSGTPKDPGRYLISVSITDDQGRTAESNALPFVIYSGEETLADQIKTENLKQYSSGLYAWDIMEPWAIKNFGSNVAGENESVRVPEKLEVWFGSHTSGTYGYLGYDIPWTQVESGNIPQTLYIPAGCNLTMTNMEILSSVHIVVEAGGKLTLSDSTVQGIIDVKNGGTFSMNYDAYNGVFATGASICGQLRLEDGAILENASIYSHINYLANGDLTDRSSAEPVVVVTGNVTVKGQVFIHGDEAGGTTVGQTALSVKNGTLTLEDGAVLAAYGGGGNTTIYPKGGTAIELDNGTITGNGKLIGMGGTATFGPGGDAVSGNGTISTSELFLQGATSYTAQNKEPGKAVNGNVSITASRRHVEDGTQVESGVNDPLGDLYWTPGVDVMPSLDKYVIKANENKPNGDNNSESESESESESTNESESVNESESTNESESISESESKKESESISASESKKESEGIRESESKSESESISESQSQGESESSSETKAASVKNKDNDKSGSNGTKNQTSPKTGDSNMVTYSFIALIISGCLLAMITVFSKKRFKRSAK